MLGWKLFRFLLVIAAIVCLVCGVVSIITTYTFCDKVVSFAEHVPAAGMWLTGIGAGVGGLMGVFAAAKS